VHGAHKGVLVVGLFGDWPIGDGDARILRYVKFWPQLERSNKGAQH
jgi:hypothetical protein